MRQKEGMALKFTITTLFHMDSRISVTSHLGDLVATLAVTQMDHLHLAGKAYKLGRSKGFAERIGEVSVQTSVFLKCTFTACRPFLFCGTALEVYKLSWEFAVSHKFVIVQ